MRNDTFIARCLLKSNQPLLKEMTLIEKAKEENKQQKTHYFLLKI